MKRFLVLCKAFFVDAQDSKASFVVTLLAPMLVFAINMWADSQGFASSVAVMDRAAVYMAYIVFTSIWNLMAYQALIAREQGTLKLLTYVAGSSCMVLSALCTVQFLLISGETTVFVVVIQLLVGMWVPGLWLMGAAVLLLAVPCALLCLASLRFTVRPQTINSIMAILMVLLFTLSLLPLHSGTWWSLFAMFNPVRFLMVGLSLPAMPMLGLPFDWLSLAQVCVAGGVYVIIGVWALKRLCVQPSVRRR